MERQRLPIRLPRAGKVAAREQQVHPSRKA
jgi:hypothetical protein